VSDAASEHSSPQRNSSSENNSSSKGSSSGKPSFEKVDPEKHVDRLPTDEEMREWRQATTAHIEAVRSMMTVMAIKLTGEGRLLKLKGQADELLTQIIQELHDRIKIHDDSKLESPEKEIFARVTPDLESVTYGSKVYEQAKDRLDVALDHHYRFNDHHPEHHRRGVAGMALPELLEMLADWVASSARHRDGSIFQSVHVNRREYDLPLPFAYRCVGTMYRLKQEEGPPERRAETHPGTFIGLAARFCALYGPNRNERSKDLLRGWTLSNTTLSIFRNTARRYGLGPPLNIGGNSHA